MSGYGMSEVNQAQGLGYPTQVSLRQEITAHITHLEKELEKKRALLALLNDNPAIEKFMDLSRS